MTNPLQPEWLGARTGPNFGEEFDTTDTISTLGGMAAGTALGFKIGSGLYQGNTPATRVLEVGIKLSCAGFGAVVGLLAGSAVGEALHPKKIS